MSSIAFVLYKLLSVAPVLLLWIVVYFDLFSKDTVHNNDTRGI